MLIDRRFLAHFDWPLFILTLAVPSFGLIVLYSAGYDPDKVYLNLEWLGVEIHSAAFVKQILFLLLGLGSMVVGLSLTSSLLFRTAFIFYGSCLTLLVSVLLFGTVSNGSRRWLSLGSFNLQPSELMKLGVILALARYLSKHPPTKGGYGFLDLVMPLLIVGVPMGLIIRQPDLGTALSVGAIGGMMILFMGVRIRALVITAVVAVLTLFPAWHTLHGYQQRRVLTLFNPESDPLGSGYHIIQSKIAVGSGSFLGKGFLKGTQSQLEFLPEHTTDFVFSVLAEEWGFVGCVLVLSLYVALIVRILRVVLKNKDLFSSLVVFGIGSLILFHTVVNIGMVIGLLPVVGIPLPLFSYGGSSVISSMFSIGIVLGVSMRRLFFVTKG